MTENKETRLGFDESGSAQAQERLATIRPFLEEGVPLSRIAEQQGHSLRTLRYWVARYRSDGFVGLAKRRRADRDRHRVRTELQTLAEALALKNPGRPIASIHRQVVQVAARQGWSAPSYDQVRAVIRELDPSLVTLAHKGTRVHKQAYDLLHRFEASGPNEIWQADHKHFDLWLEDEKGGRKKPWLTAILDDYSRAVPGYYLGFEAPSSSRTALALRQAIWRKADPRWRVCGIPAVFYTDHGSDFESNRMEQVAADLGMRLDFSMVGEPRGRGKIERLFETLEQMLLCELPGWAPEGAKPNRKEQLLTLPQLDSIFREWLLDSYHKRQHGETKQSPDMRWEAGGFLPRMPDSSENLDLLLLTVARTRQVLRDGIHFEGFRYFDLTLGPYIGETVMLRYDPRDMAEIRVYHGEQFICRAICPELAGGVFTFKDVKKANSRNRQRLRAELRDREQAVEDLLALRQHEIPEPGAAETKSSANRRPSSPESSRLKRYKNE